jgi:MoaA/NifB/PqqE/SkfB family radical SAM enzyme
MYNISEISAIHLEVTSKCQARCPMCPRRINGGPMNPFIDLNEITLEKFQNWFPIDFIKQLNHLSMCGNLGDPIIAKDTLEVFKHLRTHNKTMALVMHTNGSARTPEWFVELANINIHVVFGIDGLEDTHYLYRVDTDWQKIIDNAKAFINAGGNARWDMLAFQHNEHQIEKCRTLSQELGFREFYVKHTTRFKDGKFNVLDDSGKTKYILYPTSKSNNMINKALTAEKDILPIISCKAKKDSQMYVSADGTLTPCCWIDLQPMPPMQDSRIQYLDTIGYWPNLNKQTLYEIFDSGYFNQIENSWNTCGLKECSKQCGKFDKLGAQFEY